jgi:hypothetical protein
MPINQAQMQNIHIPTPEEMRQRFIADTIARQRYYTACPMEVARVVMHWVARRQGLTPKGEISG